MDRRRIAVMFGVFAVMLLAACSAQAHEHSAMPTNSCSGYSFGQPTWTHLTPAQVAAQGGVTATFSVQASDITGMMPSHNLTVTPGTWVGITWSSNNHASDYIYETVDSSPTHIATYNNNGASGSSAHWALTDNSTVGHTYHLFYVVTDAHGNTTQDHANLSVVAGSNPSIVNQDEIPSNLYTQVNLNFSGPSMSQSCQLCQQNPSACQGARHTPYISGSLTNLATGEVQTVQRHVAGTVVDQFTNITGYDTWTIAAGDGTDTISANTTGEIFCSAENQDIWNNLFSWRVEYAKVVVQDLGHVGRPGQDGSTIYDVQITCDSQSSPPDWQPSVVHSFAGRHQYWWGVTSVMRAPDISIMPWIPLSSFLTDWSTDEWWLPQNYPKLLATGVAFPYPGPSAHFPVPGACSRFVGYDNHGDPIYNVLMTLGSSEFPWWPFGTRN